MDVLSWLWLPGFIFFIWFMNTRNDERDAATKKAVDS